MRIEVTDQDITAGFEAIRKKLGSRADCCAVSQAVARSTGAADVTTIYHATMVQRRVSSGHDIYELPDEAAEFIRQFDNWTRGNGPRPKPITFEAEPMDPGALG